MHAAANPYEGAHFLGFFLTLGQRFMSLFQGGEGTFSLTSDEVQVLALLAMVLSSAWVGTLLVLQRMTMLANALSHTTLLGIVLVYVFLGIGVGHPGMLIAALGMGLVTNFLTEWLNGKGGLSPDASIALVFTALFALGIVAATLFAKDAHIGIEAVMGNVDALQAGDLPLLFGVAGLNGLSVWLLGKEWQMLSFDPVFARCQGVPCRVFRYLLMFQAAMTVTAAFRAVGVILVLALMTGPVLMARLYAQRFSSLMGFSVLFGLGSVLGGVALSRHFHSEGLLLSTGGVVVSLILVLYLVLVGLKRRVL